MAGVASISLLPPSGSWERLGSDRLRGLVPEGIEASCDDWGPSVMNFRVKAEAGARRVDLLPFTPVELAVDGRLCWSGFVWTRPSDANDYSVGCRGWQYHLDDDLLDRVYVHTRTGDYRDQRTFLTSVLGNFQVCGMVNLDGGASGGGIQIGWPNGSGLTGNSRVGVTLDLGPDSTGKRVVLAWQSSNNAAGTTARLVGTDVENYAGTGETLFTFAMNTGASGTTSGTFTTARRFIHLILETAAVTTTGADIWLRANSIQVFRATAYESGNASILKADQVLSDALPLAPLLNQSTAQITAGTFSLPEFTTGGYLTPRQAMEAVNTVENYRLKMGGGDLRTLVYDPKPTTPVVEVGEWSGYDFNDATVSGEEIYTRGIVDATGPDGARLVSKRTQTGTLADKRSIVRSKRLDVSAAVTSAVADRIADLWLTEHRTAPFSGTLTIVGSGARLIASGEELAPERLLAMAGEKIRFSNRVDPDTGALGRDGRIAGITYRHDDGSVELAIDDQRQRFDTILSRYAVLVGG